MSRLGDKHNGVIKKLCYLFIPGLYLIHQTKYSAGLFLLFFWLISVAPFFVLSPLFSFANINSDALIILLATSGILFYLSEKKIFGTLVSLAEQISSLFFYILFLMFPIFAVADFIVKPLLLYSADINTAILWIIYSFAISVFAFALFFRDFYNFGVGNQSYSGKGAILFQNIHWLTQRLNSIFNISPPYKGNMLSSLKLACIYSTLLWIFISISGIIMSIYHIDIFNIGFRN